MSAYMFNFNEYQDLALVEICFFVKFTFFLNSVIIALS